MDGLVEKVARVLHERNSMFPWDSVSEREQGGKARGDARAAIEAVFDEVARHLSAVQYDPAPYNALLKRLAALRKEALG